MFPAAMGCGAKKLLACCGCAQRKAGILFLGLSNSGKTTIVHVLAEEPLEHVVPTAGFSIEKFSYRKTKVTTIDMSGATKYQQLWMHYYDQAEGIAFVVDAADTTQLTAAKAVMEDVLQQPKLAGVPLLVLANKQDVLGAATAVDVAVALSLSSVKDREYAIRGCSALRNDGVQEGVSWLIHSIHSSVQ